MATFAAFGISKHSQKNVFLFLMTISKELIVRLKCNYEKNKNKKNKQPSRKHFEIMFAFKTSMRKTKCILESDI